MLEEIFPHDTLKNFLAAVRVTLMWAGLIVVAYYRCEIYEGISRFLRLRKSGIALSLFLAWFGLFLMSAAHVHWDINHRLSSEEFFNDSYLRTGATYIGAYSAMLSGVLSIYAAKGSRTAWTSFFVFNAMILVIVFVLNSIG